MIHRAMRIFVPHQPVRRLLHGGVLSLLLLSGCAPQNDGPARYDVSGTVNFKNAPLSRGRITFVPDESQGNQGPVGYAIIKEGKFNTRSSGGKGSVAGPLQALITGYDEPTPEGVEPNLPLFDNYEVPYVLDPTQKNATLHVDVELPAKPNGK